MAVLEEFNLLKKNGEALLRDFAATAYPPTVTKVTDGVYHIMGYGHSNAIAIEAEHSVILVDALDTDERAKKLKEIIDELIGKPVQTLIYTHGHPDHRGGAGVFAETLNEIIAFAPKKPLLGRMEKINDILKQRTFYQFGYTLTDEEVITQGIGIREGFVVGEGKGTPLAPTTIYTEEKVKRIIDGVELEMVLAIGETDDQIFVWLPEKQVICCGDNYYGCWPNLYALRGSQYRDVSAWVDTLNLILSYPAEYVLPGHTQPLLGKATVQEVLGNFKDAVEYVLEATLEGMNKGLSVDELATTITLPEHLRNLPYLGEFYGTVAWSVRSIYNGYVGWFDGNPTHLNKLAPKTYGEKMLELIGDSTKVIAEIKKALVEEEPQWAVELCDLLINANEEMKTAKVLKSEGLMALSRLETSANGRHYYIAAAKALLEE